MIFKNKRPVHTVTFLCVYLLRWGTRLHSHTPERQRAAHGHRVYFLFTFGASEHGEPLKVDKPPRSLPNWLLASTCLSHHWSVQRKLPIKMAVSSPFPVQMLYFQDKGFVKRGMEGGHLHWGPNGKILSRPIPRQTKFWRTWTCPHPWNEFSKDGTRPIF